VFRLSANQNNSLSNYCKLKKTTPNKLIKSLLKPYIEEYTDEKIGREYDDKLQLKLFQEEEKTYKQMKIFNEEEEVESSDANKN